MAAATAIKEIAKTTVVAVLAFNGGSMQGTGNTRSIPQRMVVDVTSGAVTTDKIAREKELCKKEEIKTSKRRG